jgi:hypothetical protein
MVVIGCWSQEKEYSMTRRVVIALAVILLGACAKPKDPQTLGAADLPDPPIMLTRTVHANEAAPAPASGIVDIPLSASQPIYSIWNDPETRIDPWGNIVLDSVEKDGTVVISLPNTSVYPFPMSMRSEKAGRWTQPLRAKLGQPFPGTGIVVIKSDPEMQSAVLRSKWVMGVKNVTP